MKYLKCFNENNYSDLLKKELTEFCDNYLAYFLDDGFLYDIGREFGRSYNGNQEIIIYKMYDDSGSKFFTWETIKDHFIPFLTILSKEYKISNEFSTPIYFVTKQGNYTLSIMAILNDNLGIIQRDNVENVEIKSISFNIENKK